MITTTHTSAKTWKRGVETDTFSDLKLLDTIGLVLAVIMALMPLSAAFYLHGTY